MLYLGIQCVVCRKNVKISYRYDLRILSEAMNVLILQCCVFLDSERSDECIDFTMIITSRNNAPISNYRGGFRCKSEYPWCIIEVKS
ncbi:Uncharacterized protein FWK35_00003523 [Aphis craccivora]|uniref:Uncharacterized protein n=1 Tax=Aphis craccivora TaxID=307492 RepID=A0A6G0Z353_APHCR|nr:Uncharacterized protein FWK35_00003523 [Aphis craccivora]